MVKSRNSTKANHSEAIEPTPSSDVSDDKNNRKRHDLQQAQVYINPLIEKPGGARASRAREMKYDAKYDTRSGYHQKNRKPSQNDKTEHGMEKTVQNQGQSPKMPKSESIQKNQQVQNFEIQFLKEATKFVQDFQSLAKEANESLAKHKALELEIECLLRAVVSQDIMSIMENNSVVDTSNLQTELERTKERFENCIIKKENEYAKLWNDWYKKCEECKHDKISYDKAYNDMHQKIERLQVQLGDQKGKSKDTLYGSNTLDPLPQKLENEDVELEFQV
ncbi:hypothetical protein Tco_0381541 [Tanacetum coccineum]